MPQDNALKICLASSEFTPLAKTDAEFKKIVNTKEWQDRCLLVQLLGELMSQGKIAGPRQCYAVNPHPRQGGKLESQFISVSDILPWQTTCAGICREGGPAEIVPR